MLQARKRDPGWTSYLFATWNHQIFSHHNKTAGNFSDAECEAIALDADTDEIACNLEGLHFETFSEPEPASRLLTQSPLIQNRRTQVSESPASVNESEVPSDAVDIPITFHNDIDLNSVEDHDDIYVPASVQPTGPNLVGDHDEFEDHDDIYAPVQPTQAGLPVPGSRSGTSLNDLSCNFIKVLSIH